jgi:hypothetical protein
MASVEAFCETCVHRIFKAIIFKVGLNRRPAIQAEARLDAGKKCVAHSPVAVQCLFPITLTDHQGGVEGRPVFDIDRHRSRQLQCLVVRFGRQRDNEIKRCVVQFPQRMWPMLRHIDPNLLHHCRNERIGLTCTHASGGDIDRAARQVLKNGGCHRRTDNVHRTGEEHCARTVVARAKVQGSAFPVQCTDEGKETARGGMIECGLAGEPLHQEPAAFIM